MEEALLVFMAEQWHVKCSVLRAAVSLSPPGSPVAPERGCVHVFCSHIVRLYLCDYDSSGRVRCLFNNHVRARESSPPFLFCSSNKPSTWSPVAAKETTVRASVESRALSVEPADSISNVTLSFRQECSRTHHF